MLKFLYSFLEWFHRALFNLTDHVITQCVDNKTHEVIQYRWIDGRPLMN